LGGGGGRRRRRRNEEGSFKKFIQNTARGVECGHATLFSVTSHFLALQSKEI
jgi:hypothetical protein